MICLMMIWVLWFHFFLWRKLNAHSLFTFFLASMISQTSVACLRFKSQVSFRSVCISLRILAALLHFFSNLIILLGYENHKCFILSYFPYHFNMFWFYFSLFALFTLYPLDNTFIELFIIIANLWLSNRVSNGCLLASSGNSFSVFPLKNQDCFLQCA